ncbi:ABC transporter substrate-binding protein [Planctomonas psychrotolerans]|uniref:ABC transporter substrate-binding protein n=1 Tax=Planctomonas psychrotolerans TaxID=2528712 RepID=UPI001D0D1E6C|nr:extracellular solute-binding protein [Planctomonas psychrotolerans]
MNVRRIITVGAITALSAGILTGCSNSSQGGSNADANSFEFWSFTGIGQGEQVEAYTAENPDITIDLTEVGQSGETAQALTTALAGGQVPDLVLIQGDELPRFVANPGNFHDLREFGADEIADDYLDWVIEQPTAEGGEIIGIPTDVGGMAMAYRTDLFEAAGFPTDRDEVSALWPTWDDFIATAEKYTAATGEPFMDNASTTVFYQAVNQVSEKYYDNDTRELNFDTNPQVKEAFELGIEAATSGTTARTPIFTEAWTAGLQNGAFAVTSAPSWMLGSIESNAPDTAGLWDIATVPVGAGNWGGSFLAIPAGADNPEAAWEYIKATQSPESQLGHFLESGSLPTTPEVYDDPELLGTTDPFFSDAPIGSIYTESLLGVDPFYIGPDSGVIGAELQAAIDNVDYADGDPAAAWDAAVTNVGNAIGG